MEISYIFIIFICIVILINLFLVATAVFFKSKINKLENKIKLLFEKRTSNIASLKEIGKEYINREEEVFKEAISLKKLEFGNFKNYNFLDFLNLESKIHHEIEFIFKIIENQKELNQDKKYKYIRGIIIEDTINIERYLNKYKSVIPKYNNIIIYKNYTIIGPLFPISKKVNI